MSMASPQQKELINSLKGKKKEEKAQLVADYCNNQGITKEQLETLYKMF